MNENEMDSVGLVEHACDHSCQEVEAGELRVLGQIGLHSETLSGVGGQQYHRAHPSTFLYTVTI